MSWLAGLAATPATPAEPLRLAVCRVYTPLPPDDGMLMGDLNRVVDERTFLVKQLEVTLVMAVPQEHEWQQTQPAAVTRSEAGRDRWERAGAAAAQVPCAGPVRVWC